MTFARTVEVDVLRGAALLGICVVNVPFLAGLDVMSTPTGMIDSAAAGIIEMFFQGKFFTLFSFLFGWSFAVQIDSVKRRGRSINVEYLRRLFGLLLLGIAHALLIFVGDILTLYAVLGLALLFVGHWTPIRLLRLAAGLTLVSTLSLATLAVVISETPPELAFPSGYLGTFTDAIHQRWFEWPYALGFVVLFNGPMALAAFCGGLAAARSGFFEPGATSYAAIRRRLPMILLIGLILNALYMLAVHDAIASDLLSLLAFSALALGAPCLSVVYLIAVVELIRSGKLGQSLAAAGRMSLTAYMAEGLIAGVIFNGYGAGLYGEVGMAVCLAIAVGIFLVVHVTSALWLSVFDRGPMEYILRLITRGHI